MKVAVDLDGTIDSFPRVFQSLMSALKAAGQQVVVLTGVSDGTVTKADVDAKRQYLTSLGISTDDYDDLIVCPKPVPKNKAKAIEDESIDLLIDNSKDNAKAAMSAVPVLLLWNSKEK